MNTSLKRWLPAVFAPVLVVAAISVPAAVAAVPPALPERSPAQVLSLVASGDKVNGYTATIEQKSNLGLPDLSGLTGAMPGAAAATPASAAPSAAVAPALTSSALTDALALLSSDQKARVQVSKQGLRVQLYTSDGEKSLTVNSANIWTWDSDAQEVTHYALPAAPDLSSEQRAKLAKLRSAIDSRLANFDPQAAATKLLSVTSQDTKVSLGSNVRVAGRSAYELVLIPKQSASLVGSVRIAIDSETGMVLRTEIYTRSGAQAYELGYTSLDLAAPAASSFTFTAPTGVKVNEAKALLAQPSAAQQKALRERIAELRAKVDQAKSTSSQSELRRELAQDSQAFAKDSAVSAGVESIASGFTVSGEGWASVAQLPAGSIDAANLKQIKSLLTPLGSGAYGLETALLSLRINADGSVAAGSVPLTSLR